MKRLLRLYRNFQVMLRDKHGATMVEYAIVVAFIAAVVVAAVTTLGMTTSGLFTNAATFFP